MGPDIETSDFSKMYIRVYFLLNIPFLRIYTTEIIAEIRQR